MQSLVVLLQFYTASETITDADIVLKKGEQKKSLHY